jgi:hypothetical protein
MQMRKLRRRKGTYRTHIKGIADRSTEGKTRDT